MDNKKEVNKFKGFKSIESFKELKRVDNIDKESLEELIGEPILVHTRWGRFFSGTVYNVKEDRIWMYTAYDETSLGVLKTHIPIFGILDVYLFEEYKELEGFFKKKV